MEKETEKVSFLLLTDMFLRGNTRKTFKLVVFGFFLLKIYEYGYFIVLHRESVVRR